MRALADTVQGMLLQPSQNVISVDPFLALLLWVLSHQQPLLPDNLFCMLRLVFSIHLAQLSLCLRGSAAAPSRFTLPVPSPPPPLASLSDLHALLTGSTAPEDSAQLLASALPFLRRCSLFVQCCLGVPLNGAQSPFVLFSLIISGRHWSVVTLQRAL